MHPGIGRLMEGAWKLSKPGCACCGPLTAERLSEALENIARSHSEETPGSRPPSEGGGRTDRSRRGVDLQLGKQQDSADGALLPAILTFLGYNPLPEVEQRRTRWAETWAVFS